MVAPLLSAAPGCPRVVRSTVKMETKANKSTVADGNRSVPATSALQQQKLRQSTLSSSRRTVQANKSAPEGAIGQQRRITSSSTRGRCSSAQLANERRTRPANDRERTDGAKGARQAVSSLASNSVGSVRRCDDGKRRAPVVSKPSVTTRPSSARPAAGSTNPLAVNSRIPRMLRQPTSPTNKPMDDDLQSTPSSLDLSLVGRNRSSVSSVASSSVSVKTSRIPPPGSIAAKNLKNQQHRSAAVKAAPHREPRATADNRKKECVAGGGARGPTQGREGSSRSFVTPVAAPSRPPETLPIAEPQHLSASVSRQACEPDTVPENSANSDTTMSETSEQTTENPTRVVTESCEMLVRLESERQSIRGPPTVAPPVTQADAQLMEMLESDVLGAVSGPRRSFSLPKSFLSSKYGFTGLRAALPSVRFPWRSKTHQTEAPAQEEPKSLPPAVTTGVAPIRRLTPVERQVKCNSAYLESENRSLSALDLTSRRWSVYEEASESELAVVSDLADPTEETNDSPANNSATTRKFRKSFSLRLNRRASQDESSKEENDAESAESGSKFRFGVFRASRERNNKKACPNKAARNAKCNSGDSGVQMEAPSNDEIDCPARRASVTDDETVKNESLGSFSVQTSKSLVPFIRSRKLSRHLAKAKLRRSASQPVVVIQQSPSKGDGPSDEDAGLYLSEDENLSDDAHDGQMSRPIEGVLAIALWNHTAVEPEELSLQAGDMVHVLDLSDPNWWWASSGSNYGWLPAAYVQLCEQPGSPQRAALNLRHSVRANVINELITAERDYVKLLSDLVEGYLQPMRSRPDLFSQKTIESIFGNLEELYRFQKKFLVDLELALDWGVLEDSVVGNVFIQHIQNFTIYATYCNNHDRAATQMQTLYKDLRYVKFFEACRLLRRMIRLPLEAFLLSPVQKICKYPLQLAELLKHTPEDHPDRNRVSRALESMRSVACLVNESKRKAEMHQFLVEWQSGVDHWTGPDVAEVNTRLIRQGEMYKISANGWTREVTLFLFDKELVLCKKDLIKRSSLVYKDRLSIADVELFEPAGPLMDGRPNAFQLRSRAGKWYTLACRTEPDKRQWVSAIRQLQQEPDCCWTASPASDQFPTALLARQKAASANKRNKAKQSALKLTLEEARLTLAGHDVPTTVGKRKL